MSKKNLTNNEHLRELVSGAGLTQPEALALFNRQLKVRSVKDSSWKAYFCNPGVTRYRNFNDDLMSHAVKVFTPLQMKKGG